jgi:hypothetical protein
MGSEGLVDQPCGTWDNHAQCYPIWAEMGLPKHKMGVSSAMIKGWFLLTKDYD